MKSKLLLIFLISFFQIKAQQKYPIKTFFKGDSVVILKYDQAIKINAALEENKQIISQNGLLLEYKNADLRKNAKIISSLKDTVKDLRWKLNVTEADLGRKLSKSKDSLSVISQQMITANSQIEFYKKEMKRIEKLEWIEKRTRVQMKVGIAAVLVSWITLVILSK